MSLLKRIAVSNGDKLRKARANLILAGLDQPKVAHWNNKLRAEIRQKRLEHLSPRLSVKKNV
jgi:hypothetical protein